MFSCCGRRWDGHHCWKPWASLGGLQRSAPLLKPRERYAHLAKPTGHSTTHTGAWSKHTCRMLKNLPHPGNLSCSLWDWLGPFHTPRLSVLLTIPGACKASQVCTAPPPGTFPGSPEDPELSTVSIQQERRQVLLTRSPSVHGGN